MAWAHVQENYRRWGAPRALHISIMNLLARFGIEVVFVYNRPLVDEPGDAFEENGIAYRSLVKADLELASTDPELDISGEFLAKVLPRGDVCCGAFDGDKLVSYAWRSGLEADHVPGLKVVVAEHCRYGYKAFTRPGYRGRGIYPRLTDMEDRAYIKSGKTTVVAFTATHNYSSLKLNKKLGNSIIGLAGYWKVGNRFLLFHTPGVKRRALRFVRTRS